MATIASLNVNLGMNPAAFSKGSKKATTDIQAMQGSLSFAALAGGVTAAIAVYQQFIGTVSRAASALSDLVLTTAAEVDKVDELAQSLGVSVEALSRLQYAAKRAGSDSEALGGALAKMQQTLGKGKNAAAFEAIGLSVQELKELSPDEQFLQIADALNTVPNQAERAAAGMAIFGKGVVNINNALNAGSDALRAFGRESDLLGNTITKFEAERIARFNDELDRANAAFKGASQTITVELAPALADGLIAISAWTVEIGKTVDKVDELSSMDWLTMFSTLDGPQQAVKLFQDVNKTAAELATNSVNMQAVEAATAKAAAQQAHNNEQTKEYLNLLETLQNEIAHFGKEGFERQIAELDATDEQIAQLTMLANQYAALKQQEQERIDRAKQWAEILEAQAAKEKELADARQAAEKAIADRGKNRLASLETPFQKLQRELKEIAEERAAGIPGFDDNAALQAQLEARAEFLKATEPEADVGPQRPAALERGSAAAFSASFGAVAKPATEQLRVMKQLLEVTKQREKIEILTIGA